MWHVQRIIGISQLESKTKKTRGFYLFYEYFSPVACHFVAADYNVADVQRTHRALHSLLPQLFNLINRCGEVAWLRAFGEHFHSNSLLLFYYVIVCGCVLATSGQHCLWQVRKCATTTKKKKKYSRNGSDSLARDQSARHFKHSFGPMTAERRIEKRSRTQNCALHCIELKCSFTVRRQFMFRVMHIDEERHF